MVQTPWKKLYVALVFVSDEGAGKSLVWNRFMGAILGNNFMAQANHQAILGNFNDSLSGKLLVVAEELCWNGMQGSGILKDLHLWPLPLAQAMIVNPEFWISMVLLVFDPL